MGRKFLIPIVSGIVILLAFVISSIFSAEKSRQQQLKQEQVKRAELAQQVQKCRALLTGLKGQVEVTAPDTPQFSQLLSQFKKVPTRCKELTPHLYQLVQRAILEKGGKVAQLREECLRRQVVLEKGIETATTEDGIKELREEVLKLVEGRCAPFVEATQLLQKLNRRQQALLGCRDELKLLKRDILSAQSVEELIPLKQEVKGLLKSCGVVGDEVARVAQLLHRRELILQKRSLEQDLKLKKCREQLVLLKGKVLGATSLAVLEGLKQEILTLSNRCPQLDTSQVLELVAQQEGRLRTAQLAEQEKLASCRGELEIVKEGIMTAQSQSELDNYLSQGRKVIRRCPSLLPSLKSLISLANQKREQLKIAQQQAETEQCRLKLEGIRELVAVSTSTAQLNKLLLQLQNMDCPQLYKPISDLMVKIQKRIAQLEESYRQCDAKYQELELRFQKAKGFFHSDREEIARIKGEAMKLRDNGTCKPSTLRELEILIEKCNDEL